MSRTDEKKTRFREKFTNARQVSDKSRKKCEINFDSEGAVLVS